MQDPVVTLTLTEKGKDITRNVYPLLLTPENIKRFYDEAKKYPVIFGHAIPTQQDFLDAFVFYNRHEEPELNGLFWVVDDFVGIFYITNIFPCEECDVHYTFFDRLHKGRVPLVKKMLEFLFLKYDFHRVNASIPAYAEGAHQYARDCGFVQEGRKRNSAKWKGNRFDIILYGLLRQEVLGDGR